MWSRTGGYRPDPLCDSGPANAEVAGLLQNRVCVPRVPITQAFAGCPDGWELAGLAVEVHSWSWGLLWVWSVLLGFRGERFSVPRCSHVGPRLVSWEVAARSTSRGLVDFVRQIAGLESVDRCSACRGPESGSRPVSSTHGQELQTGRCADEGLRVGSTALCDCMTHGMPRGISDTSD